MFYRYNLQKQKIQRQFRLSFIHFHSQDATQKTDLEFWIECEQVCLPRAIEMITHLQCA